MWPVQPAFGTPHASSSSHWSWIARLSQAATSGVRCLDTCEDAACQLMLPPIP